MELPGVCPGGEFGDKVELTEKFTHHLTGVVSLTEILELRHEPRQGVFRLANRDVRVVLALAFEAGVVLLQLTPIEIGETTARGAVKWSLMS
jgi:hypothetical protein